MANAVPQAVKARHDMFVCVIRNLINSLAFADIYEKWAQRYPYVMKRDVKTYLPRWTDSSCSLRSPAAPRMTADSGCSSESSIMLRRRPHVAPTVATLFPGDELAGSVSRLPIGSLTSQVLANRYLTRLDHWIAVTCDPPRRMLQLASTMKTAHSRMP